MSDGIYTALTGAMVMDQNLEILGNNLANSSTPGFKGVRPVFQSVLARAQPAAEGAEAAQNPDARTGVQIAELGTDFTQGSMVETGNDLDVALEGQGMIAVQTPQGVRYTRHGTLQVDAQRRLTIAGQPVRQAGGGEIVLPEQTYLSIGEDGEVYADEASVGKMEIVSFNDPGNLQPVGGGFFQGNGGQPDEETVVMQGFLENSNVNPVWGMTELIRVTRTFEAAQKVIQTYRDMDRKLTSEIGRTL